MNRYKGRVLKTIVLALVIVLAIAIFVGYTVGDYLLAHGFIFFAVREAHYRQIRLLCNTDHRALLEACRELSELTARGDLKPGRYRIYMDPDPEASRFPKPLLDLNPSYVYIDENDCGRVMVEMLGGLGHLGVQAYTENYKKPSWAEYGDRELIPGLWYYDDGYNDNPEYNKKIDALIQKGK